VSSTGISCLGRNGAGESISSSDVVEDVLVEETIEGGRDGNDEVGEVPESASDRVFDSVEGVVRRKGPLVCRFRAIIDDLANKDISE
jgi:hypothetical protein